MIYLLRDDLSYSIRNIEGKERERKRKKESEATLLMDAMQRTILSRGLSQERKGKARVLPLRSFPIWPIWRSRFRGLCVGAVL
jgi:hypothetical protein